MTKQDFINLGIEEELAEKCEIASATELENYVSMEEFSKLDSELKSSYENAEKQLHQIKVEYALETALCNSNAINSKTVIPLLNGLEQATFDETGDLVGLQEQIETLKNSEETKFLFKPEDIEIPTSKIVGASIGESSDFEEYNNGNYATISRLLAQNPNMML